MNKFSNRVVRKVVGFVRDARIRREYPQLKTAFRIQSHLTVEERVQLYIIAVNRGAICEIGSYVGASACCFGAAAKESGSGQVLCIDTWTNDAMSEGHRQTWSEFAENTAEYRDLLRPIRGFSTEVIDEVRAHATILDVLFIDGDHSYEGVKADWDNYKGMLKVGSVVVFHDYGWADGVRRVVHDEVVPLTTNRGSLPNMWWGTLSIAP